MKIYINGLLCADSEAKISVTDHAVLYGDGVYEGIRVYNGYAFALDAHLERLIRSAIAIGIVPPSPDIVTSAIRETLADNGLTSAYIRVIYTRGSGDMGPNPLSCNNPSLIVIAQDIPPLHRHGANGIRMIISHRRRSAVDANTHEIKSLNYLDSVLAMAEAQAANADDAIMLDPNGYVAEAVVSNVFVVDNEELYTPSLDGPILAGITRAATIKIASEIGIRVHETKITPTFLLTAKGAFTTGTHAEIVRIASIGTREYTDDKAKNMITMIQDEYSRLKSSPNYGTLVV